MKNEPNIRSTIYLSGGMQFADELGAQWRLECAEELKLMSYRPIDITKLDREYAKEHGQLYFSHITEKRQHLKYKSNFRRHFVDADLKLVTDDSDAVIIYYDESVRRGAGATSECQVAFNTNIPVFLVSAYSDWSTQVPGWMQALTTKIFTEFDDLYSYLEDLPWGILKKDSYGNRGVHNCYLCSLCGDVFTKNKQHFVSKVTPTYCNSCVDLVAQTHQSHPDRYEFIIERI